MCLTCIRDGIIGIVAPIILGGMGTFIETSKGEYEFIIHYSSNI